jgi:succinate dehydrogenase/fumarate reductase-like Fe-S protein
MPFSNIINLQVRAFFFNAATDYLPYYKNFDITIDKGATLLEVLSKIKAKNPDFSFPNKKIILKVNDKITEAETLVVNVVESIGTELQIDPALTYRSNNGLILNDDDFMENFELLAPYASEADKTYYESLYALHYASETTNYNRQFIGDAILVLAHKMIADGNENKEAILTAISDEFNGIRCCEYENNVLNGEDHTQSIANLKKMLILKDTASFFDKLTYGKKDHSIDLETLASSNVALYVGSKEDDLDSVRTLIKNNASSYVQFDKSTKLAGQTLMGSHFQIAHQKAGLMLLDALDSGADILVCIKRDVTIFQTAINSCEKSMGRDIKLKIISLHTLKELCGLSA